MENQIELTILKEINEKLPKYRNKKTYFNIEQLRERILTEENVQLEKALIEFKEEDVSKVVESLVGNLKLNKFERSFSGEKKLQELVLKYQSTLVYGIDGADENSVQRDFFRDFDNFQDVATNISETQNFRIKWANKADFPNSLHAVDEEIVLKTEKYLEDSLKKFREVFDKSADIVEEQGIRKDGKKLIEVDIAEFESTSLYGATNPVLPIFLNAHHLNLREPIPHKTTIAHEVFHRVLYAYGHKSGWGNGNDALEWLDEGLAAWAEIFVYNKVNNENKLLTLAEPPYYSPFDAQESAVLFWIFFDKSQSEENKDNEIAPLRGKYIENFLEHCLSLGKPLKAFVKSLGGQKGFNEFCASFTFFQIAKAKKLIKDNYSIEPRTNRDLNNFFEEGSHQIEPLDNDTFKFILNRDSPSELHIIEEVPEGKKAQLRIKVYPNEGEPHKVKKRKIRNIWKHRHKIPLSKFQASNDITIIIFRIEEDGYEDLLTYQNIKIT